MKRTTNYARAIQVLNKMFRAANEFYFNNELEDVCITIQSSVRSFAHISVSPVWRDIDGRHLREINLSAEHLMRDGENEYGVLSVAASLLHEMSHLYNLEHEIKDTSTNGYHNRRFAKTAEEIAHLKISKHDIYGWTLTSPTSDQDVDDGKSTLDFVVQYGFEDFLFSRDAEFSINTGTGTANTGNGGVKPTPIKKKSNSKRYQCPVCKAIVRATSTVNIICGDCNVPFILTNG